MVTLRPCVSCRSSRTFVVSTTKLSIYLSIPSHKPYFLLCAREQLGGRPASRMPSMDLPEPPSPRSGRVATPPPRTGGFTKRPNPRESSYREAPEVEVGTEAVGTEAVREVGVVLPPLSAVPVPLVSGLGDGAEHTENGQQTPRRTRLPSPPEEAQRGRRATDGEPSPKPSPKPSTKPSPRPSPRPSPSPRRSGIAADGARSSGHGGGGAEATAAAAPKQALVEGGGSLGMPVPEMRQDSRSASPGFGHRATKRGGGIAGVATRASGDVSSAQTPADEELASFLGDAVRGKPVAPTVAAAAAAAAGASEVDAKLATPNPDPNPNPNPHPDPDPHPHPSPSPNPNPNLRGGRQACEATELRGQRAGAGAAAAARRRAGGA